MGNNTNTENWAAQERLRALERSIWWRGWVKRKDLQQLFGVSLAQASSDLQKYLEINPGAMNYHLNHKRYEASENMACVLHTPLFEDAVRSFIPSANTGILPSSSTMDSDLVALVNLPNRTGKPEIQRRILQAFLNAQQIRLKYWSLSSGKIKLRSIIPKGFAHDGYRWHTRAWCCEHKDYRDFVLSRISLIKELSDPEMDPPEDIEWNTMETIKLKPNSALSENSRRAVELDYGIRKNGTLTLKVRSAMKRYFLSHMRVDEVQLDSHFEVL